MLTFDQQSSASPAQLRTPYPLLTSSSASRAVCLMSSRLLLPRILHGRQALPPQVSPCSLCDADMHLCFHPGIVTNIDPGVAITVLDHALNFQMTYGAVMLSFLGALHWGFEFASYGGVKG